MNPLSFSHKISQNLSFSNHQNAHQLQENVEKHVRIVLVASKNWKKRKAQMHGNYPLSFWAKMNWISPCKGKRVVVEIVDWEMLFDVRDV
jgi:predicted nucleic acid-binding protein